MPIDPTNPRTSIDRKLVEYDDKMRSLDLWRMNLVPPEVGIFDEPKRCYELNNEWAKIVMGLVSWLADTPIWRDAENEGYFAISEILKFMIGSDCFMFDVRQNPTQPCLLDYSVDGGDNWTQFADITQCVSQSFLENSIINALNSNTTIQNIIDQLVDGGTDNDLPPTPTVSEPDLLCDSAYYMTDQIIDFIDQTITDAATITLEEFLTALLGLGGFEGSLLVLFWQLIVANSYPGLLTDVQAARDEVAKYLYCNELDKNLVTLDIDASLTIGEEAQAALIGAINAITDGKWSLWAFVGSQVDSGEDCSAFCPNCPEYDFTIDSQGWNGATFGFSVFIPRAVYTAGQGWGPNPSQLRGQVGIQLNYVGTLDSIQVALDMPITGDRQWLVRVDGVNVINEIGSGQSKTFTFAEKTVTNNIQVFAIDNSVSGGGATLAPFKIVLAKPCGLGMPT